MRARCHGQLWYELYTERERGVRVLIVRVVDADLGGGPETIGRSVIERERTCTRPLDRIRTIDVEFEIRQDPEIDLEVGYHHAPRPLAANHAELEVDFERAGLLELEIRGLEQRPHTAGLRASGAKQQPDRRAQRRATHERARDARVVRTRSRLDPAPLDHARDARIEAVASWHFFPNCDVRATCAIFVSHECG